MTKLIKIIYQLTKFQTPRSNNFLDILLSKVSKGHNFGKLDGIVSKVN